MKEVPKGWGKELWIANSPLYCGKKLIVQMELQHTDGKKESFVMNPGDSLHIPQLLVHRFTGIEDSEIFEFSTQHFDEDSHRLELGTQP